MSKTVIIVLVVVAVGGIAAFVLLSKKKPTTAAPVAPPVSIPKQTNLASNILSAAPSLINSLSSAYSTYEEYKD